MTYKTPGMYGKEFEKRVCRAFERQGLKTVHENYWMKNYAFDKDSAKRREYDLVMYDRSDKQFYIIECKAHMNKELFVPIGLVKEFTNKIRVYHGRAAYNLMVTDTDYSSSAKEFAKKNNILLMDGKQLRSLENKDPKKSMSASEYLFELLFLGLKIFVR